MLAAAVAGLVASLLPAAPAAADSVEYLAMDPVRVADTPDGTGGASVGRVAGQFPTLVRR